MSTDKRLADMEREIAETRNDLDETLDLLQAKLSPSSLLDEFSSRTSRRSFSDKVAPLFATRPLTATLLSLGVNWYLSRRERASQEHDTDVPRRQVRQRVRELTSRARRRAADSADQVRGRATEIAGHVEQFAETEREHLREGVQSVSAKAHDIATAAQEAAHETLSAAESKAHDLAASVSQRAQQLGEKAAERAHTAVDTTRERAARYKVQARERVDVTQKKAAALFQEHPLLIGAVAALAGAAIAASLPASGPERKILKPAARKLRTKAQEKIARGINQGTELATAVIETTVEKIEKGMNEAEKPALH